jgi:hypothetical protein
MFYLNGGVLDPNKKVNIPSFFIQPVKTTKFTLIKAPMAHKTFSQEQYVFKYYKLTISFKGVQSPDTLCNSVNDSLYYALSLRKSLLLFETNFFFLKKLSFNFTAKDNNFLLLF